MKTVVANENMRKFQDLLLEDFKASKNHGIKNPSLFAVRTNIRTASAYIEGTIYQLRLVCLAASEDVPTIFDNSEILLLREKLVFLNERGEVKEKDSFQNIKSSLLFTTGLFARIHQISFTPDLSNNGWESFQKFFKIRNNLMHPKSLSDFQISEQDNKTCVEAVKWFNSTISSLFRKCEMADSNS